MLLLLLKGAKGPHYLCLAVWWHGMAVHTAPRHGPGRCTQARSPGA